MEKPVTAEMATSAMKSHRLSSGKKFLFVGLVLLLVVAFPFGALEAYLRLFKPTTDLYKLTGRVAGADLMSVWGVADAFCAYRMKPGQIAEGKTVNKDGFISTPEIKPAKTEGTVRIVFLGESSTAGVGGDILKDSETWPWRTIEMIAEKSGVKVDFINGAAGGYTSFESYGRLWSRIRHFSPDVVVVYHGWNEMYYFDDADSILSWRTQNDGSWSFVNWREPITVYSPQWIDPLLAWSQALTRIRLRLSRPETGELGPQNTRPLRGDFNHKGPDIWRTHLRLLRATCDVIDARLFVAKQATLVVPGLPEEQRKRCRYNLHRLDHDALVRAFDEIYKVIDQEIPADAVIDVTRLSGRPECFSDHIHPTPYGADQIAAIMSDVLAAYIMQLNDSRKTFSSVSEGARGADAHMALTRR